MRRCSWVSNEEIYVAYHDTEWGKPVHDDRLLFEMLILEGFQAGLSWLTVLKKRSAFRVAFDNFDVAKVAAYDEQKVAQLLQNEQIIRSRQKICAAIQNAKVFMAIQREFGSFAEYLWHWSEHKIMRYGIFPPPAENALSQKIAQDLKKRGMKYAGSVIIYAYLQAVGVIDDHEPACFLHKVKV